MNKIRMTSFLFLIVISANGQTFQNLQFRQLCDTSKTGLCYWDLSWGSKGSVQPQIIGKQNCVLIVGKSGASTGLIEQSTINNLTSTSIIKISANIKSDTVEGKGAGLNIGLYNKNGKLIANQDMGGYYSINWIKGTTNWKTYSVSIICPPETFKIKIGAILYGKGKAWFKDYNVSVAPIENRKPSKLAKTYIEAACDTIKNNSLFRDSFNIQLSRTTALKISGNAKKYSDCYLAINYLLESLRPYGDEHSFFMTAAEVKNWENEGSQVSKIKFPSYQLIKGCGYIQVPPFHGGNQKQILAFADTLQQMISNLYGSGIKGWIIDLTQNTGGNMAPMIAGLGPLFSSEKLGALIDVNGRTNAWYYKNGRYFWDNDSGWTVSHAVQLPVQLSIAVLIGEQTGSSGEAVAVSFIENAKTKFFGQPTWGLTTGNGSFELKDGSRIFLASTIMADRKGNEYRSRINPDYLVDGGTSNLIDKAIEWIMSSYK